MSQLGQAQLVMHSPSDITIPIERALRMYNTAHHPKSFLSLEGADHLLSHSRDAQYAADVLAAWSAPYIQG